MIAINRSTRNLIDRLQGAFGQLAYIVGRVGRYARCRVRILRPAPVKRSLDAYPHGPAQRALHAQLLGGTDTRVLATMIYQYAMSLRDWAQASVVAVVMIVTGYMAYIRQVKKQKK